DGWLMDTELLVIAERLGYRIFDLPVRWVEDRDSRVKVGRDAFAAVKGLLRLRRNLSNGNYGQVRSAKGSFKNKFRFCWRLFGLLARRERRAYPQRSVRSEQRSQQAKEPQLGGAGRRRAICFVARRSQPRFGGCSLPGSTGSRPTEPETAVQQVQSGPR